MSDRDALIAALSPDTVIAPEHMAEALYLARQEAIRLTGDRDRLASLLEKLRMHVAHGGGAWTICFHCGEVEGALHAEGCASAIARAALASTEAPERPGIIPSWDTPG